MTIALPPPPDGAILPEVPDRRHSGLSAIERPPAEIAAVQRLGLLDTPAEQAFDRLTRLAAKILHAPAALLSLVDGERSFFKSSVGLPEPWASRREMPQSESVCQLVVAANAPLVINDARADPLVSDNQAVAELRIVAYLGIPLITSEGHAIGTFAVIDTVPREWTPDDVTTLGDLAASAMTEIELRAEANQRQFVEQRLKLMESIVASSTAAVLIAEANPAEPFVPRVVFVNDAYTRLTGYSQDDVVGTTFQLLNRRETDHAQIETVRTALAAWKPARIEHLTRRKDGSEFWAESNIVPIADKAGCYTQWVVVQRDSSVERRAEEALRASEARRRAILKSAPDCIITLDTQKRVTEFNPTAEKTFGYSRADALGKALSDLIVPPFQSECQTWIPPQCATTEADSTVEKRLELTAVRADGTRFPAELAFVTIPREGPMYIAFLRDITERERAKRRLTAQYTCTGIIADSSVMDDTIPKILRALCENLGWCLGQMWQMDPKADVLRCVAAWHDPAAAVADFTDLSRTTTFRPGSGLPGRVWASREPHWVSDVMSDHNFPRADVAHRCGLKSAFAFPILHGEKVLGIMEFLHESTRKPDGPLLDMVAAVGSQVGQFIERMETDEALRRSEERYRYLVLASAQVVWTTDAAGQLILDDSSTWQTYTGQTMEEAQGAGWLDALHPDDRDRVAVTWAHALARKTCCQIEYRLRTAAGEYRHTVSRGVPVVGTDGQVQEWVGTNNDITEQKLAEEALRNSEAEMRRLALIAQRTDNAVVLTDRQGRIEWVNDGFTRICEHRLEDVVGKTPGSVLQGPDTDLTTVAHMREQLRKGQGFHVEILNYTRSRRAYWSAIEVQPVHDDQGMLTRFMAIESDITTRKRTEEMLKEANQDLELKVSRRTTELSETNEFLKALLENVQDGIVACNCKGEFTLLNRSTREFGNPRGEMDFPPSDPTIRPDQWPAHYGLYRPDGQTLMSMDEMPLVRALRGERVQDAEMVIFPKGGAARTILASGRAFYDGQGTKLGAVVSLNDITDRKRAEEELQKAHDELETRVEERTAELALAKEAAEAANQAKSEFFSRMSHELRTPLNVILGFGQLLELDTLTDSQRESAEQIGKGGRHLLALINEVLDIARIEAGATGIVSLEEVDLGAVVGEVLGMIQPLADRAGVRLVPPQLPQAEWAVRADLQRLKQVLLNLLSNGIKYNRQGGTVAVSCAEADGTRVQISVTDTGPGIPPEKMHRLFAPFDRLEAEQKGVEGTGLGLTLSKGLVAAMQGKMGVESTVGTGSTFWIELPRIDRTGEPACADPAAIADPDEVSGTTGTVLYIEDNPANFRLVERILKHRSGVCMLSATRGQQGIEMARLCRPDLIFLDLHLPDLPGGEVLSQLREDPGTSAIPIIVVSADGTPKQIERLVAAGATRYLVKPLDVKEFLRIIDETLNEGIL